MTEPAFVPISPNPYIVGNPVRGRAMFFGREAEFALVHKRFGDSEHGGLLVFCGERRSGKTSILFQILDRRLGPDFIPVLIDMQSMAVSSEAEFLARLAEEILAAFGADARDVKPPDFMANSNRSAIFQRFVQDCLRAQPGRKLILLFDEYELFETKIDGGLLSKDVLYILASLMESKPVFMIFTGSQHLEARRRDYWNVLGKSIFKQVSYLEREDAESLIRQPVKGKVDWEEPAVGSILRLAAGQPFYTQAICQSLIDQLNDRQTRGATLERLGDVVDGIVNNPLPQMIFLWDGLERLDKLVMALLAEALADANERAGVDDLIRHVKRRRYPLEIEVGDIATTLEKLFKSEMLLRDDRGAKPAYAFRMDLWRLWIRRQHSVWQVLREEGLAGRSRPRPRWIAAAIMALFVVATAGAAFLLRGPAPPPTAAGSGPQGFLDLAVEPALASISINGRRVGIGALADSVSAGIEHRVLLSAAGFADSSILLNVAEGQRVARHVALRPLLGDLRVETQPPNAEVRVDGKIVGRSPLTISGLAVATPHAVEASLPGYAVSRSDVTVQ
ncbi:MAG TPA: PEGA domain-containing protein, partial [Candidatus Eisenbacteria bacterium]|nr:PEGA domain-containing protein [Candidatus Eisenbacteria bacterium]